MTLSPKQEKTLANLFRPYLEGFTLNDYFLEEGREWMVILGVKDGNSWDIYFVQWDGGWYQVFDHTR